MRKLSYTALAMVFLAGISAGPVYAQAPVDEPGTQKLAQTGFKFLAVSPDARSASLADAVTAQEMASPMAMFYNPSGMARMESTFQVAAGQTQWIADISYNVAAVAFRPAGGTYGVFGLSLVAVDYGTITGTIRDASEAGFARFEDIGLANPNPTALAVGLGYARALTDRFSVGGHVKYALQDLGTSVTAVENGGFMTSEFSENTFVVDFGVNYQTGFRSLNFAMSARNFSPELTYVQENFELPLTFNIGVGMDLMDLTAMDQNMHSLYFAIDAERPRDYSERLKIGGEYTFMNMFALRGGYIMPTDEQGVNLGVGLTPRFGDIGFSFDYAYTTFGVFDAVHRLAVQLSF